MRNKTKYVKLTGKIAWAMIYSPDEYRDREFYKISFYPDAASAVEFKKLGLNNKWKYDDGGKSGVEGDYVTLKRYTQQETRKGTIEYNPPEVYDVDGNPLVQYKTNRKGHAVFEDGEPVEVTGNDPILIGNGSTVEIKLEVYKGKNGAGARLDSIRVIDLIVYNPEEDEDEEEEEAKPEPKKSKTKKDKFEW